MDYKMRMGFMQITRLFLTLTMFSLLAVAPLEADELTDALAALQRGASEQALPLLRQAVRQSPQRNDLKGLLAECSLTVAREQMQRREFLAAAATLASAREETGAAEDGRFWRERGHALFAAGDLSGAEGELRQALQLNRGDLAALGMLARIHYDRGELYEAELLLQEALALQPNDAQLVELNQKVAREREYEEKLSTSVGGIFKVSFDGEANDRLGDEVRAALEEAYIDVGRRFDQFPAGPIPVILYSTKDFLSMTGAPEWSGGLYDGKIRVPVGGLAGLTPALRNVLYHEYTHLLIAQRAGRNVPRWLNEGLAEVIAVGAQHERTEPLSQLEPIMALEQLERSLSATSSQEVERAYRQAYLQVKYLLESCGWSEMLSLLDQLAKHSAFAERTLCGNDVAAMVDEWRRSVAGRGVGDR
jgi:tetratricopeptide (TPR) repeat protein